MLEKKKSTFPLPLATPPHITKPTKYEQRAHTVHGPSPRSAHTTEKIQNTHCNRDLKQTCTVRLGRARSGSRVAHTRTAVTSDRLLAAASDQE